jgi:glucokinase
MGGTNTRCALSQGPGIDAIRHFRNADFDGPAALLQTYCASLPAAMRPAAAALAVAAPVLGDRVKLLNIDWEFSAAALQASLGFERIGVLNDFAALAYALPGLGRPDLQQLGGGAAVTGQPKVVLGPGTGLGVAALLPVGAGWQAISGEGGHVSLPASDATEAGVIEAARTRFGHCSAERLISGPGLALLHELLHKGVTSNPESISGLAETGDPQATQTLHMFCRLLGTVAGDLALTFGAFGGVYIAGGILPRLAAQLAVSGFRARFEAKGRYAAYLGGIPTWLITSADPTLRGLAAWSTDWGG